MYGDPWREQRYTMTDASAAAARWQSCALLEAVVSTPGT
jgi:hypothetical protein